MVPPCGHACSAAQPVDTVAPPAEIDVAALEAEIRRNVPPDWWGAILVSRNGVVKVAAGIGLIHDEVRPIDENTLFDIASCAKAMTAATILRLAETNILALDHPVATFFPDLTGDALERGKVVTVRHLLGHTAGLDDSTAIQSLIFPDRDEAVQRAFAAPPLSGPGERFRYSNTGYVVLAAIIEKATNQRFEDVAKELVLDPAGLTNTGFLNTEELDDSNAAPRVLERGGKVHRLTIRQDGWGWGYKGAGGVLTTMAELARWDAALADDSVLSEASRDAMFTRGKGGYGLGWFIETNSRGTRRIHHSGGTRGFTCWFVRLPEENTFIAVLSNQRGRPNTIAKLVEDFLFPPLPESAVGGFTLGDRTENKHGLALVGELLLWRPATDAERANADASVPKSSHGIVLERATDGAKIMDLWISHGTAARLNAELISATPPPDVALAPAIRPSVLSLMSRAYGASASSFATLADGLTLSIRDRYLGFGEAGSFEDVRPTFTIIDKARGMWPVIVRMDAHTAATLGETLQAGLKTPP